VRQFTANVRVPEIALPIERNLKMNTHSEQHQVLYALAFLVAMALAEGASAGGVLYVPARGGLPACQEALAACQAAQAQSLPATGQVTCWNNGGVVIDCTNTGQDGEIQVGASLRYMDNGDGTITDMNTILQWEKKSADGSIHDVDKTYSWDEAFSVHVAGLNAMNFAGYNDWRVPNIRELQSIMNYEAVTPAISEPFNHDCEPGVTVLTGSCTAPTPTGPWNFSYWSSTSAQVNPWTAYYGGFHGGDVNPEDKSAGRNHVRAVRGGL
jgi:hypothetical protein